MGHLSAAERDAVAWTYAVFDPLAVAPAIDIPVLVSVAGDARARAAAALLSVLKRGERFNVSGRDYEDDEAADRWLAGSLVRSMP